MYTGIITACEKIVNIEDHQGNKIFTINLPAEWTKEMPQIGESINVCGVCSTVIKIDSDTFTVEYMPETLRLTTMGDRKVGDEMNLERSMKNQDFLSGYLIYGHIDGTGKIVAVQEDGASHLITIQHKKKFDKYVINKGCITVCGIAMTACNVQSGQFDIAVIPHTWEVTNLHAAQKGATVNLEYDVIAKYIEKIYSDNNPWLKEQKKNS